LLVDPLSGRTQPWIRYGNGQKDIPERIDLHVSRGPADHS
jgi:hypothetical protein